MPPNNLKILMINKRKSKEHLEEVKVGFKFYCLSNDSLAYFQFDTIAPWRLVSHHWIFEQHCHFSSFDILELDINILDMYAEKKYFTLVNNLFPWAQDKHLNLVWTVVSDWSTILSSLYVLFTGQPILDCNKTVFFICINISGLEYLFSRV